MKANELMIGDWVLTLDSTHKEKVFAQIDAIEEGQHSILVTRECSNWFVDIDWIESISLTPEVLEKNGFLCEQDRWWWQDFYITLASTKALTLVCNRTIQIKYVHQLQHALRFCGIEKEINL